MLSVSGLLVPFSKTPNWQKFETFANNIALLMEEKWPEKYTTNIRKKERKGKIFIDWLRNSRGATCVAPYSLRVRELPRVSMPIAWSELDKIAPDGVDIAMAKKRLSKKDPWADFFEVKQVLK